MNATVVLGLSVFLQFLAALLALRLVRVTGRRWAWGCISAAILLMAVRRSVTWYRLLSGDVSLPPDASAEFIALGISVLMVLGVASIAPYFSTLRQSEKAREEAELALNESEGRFERLIESAPDAMVFANKDGTIVLVNHQTEHLTGFSREDLVGQKVEMLVPERARADHPENRGPFLQEPMTRGMGTALELACLRKDGTEFPAEISLSPVETKEGLLVAGAIRDISEKKKAQTALRASKERLRELVESTKAIPWECNVRTYRFTFVGGRAQDITGYPTHEWLAPSFWEDHIHEADREWAVRFCIRNAAECDDYEFEYRMKTRDGRTIWIHDVVHVVRDAQGPKLLRGFLIDITERKRIETELALHREHLEDLVQERTQELETAQAELVRKTRLATLGQLAGSVAHELRNPLGAVRNAAFFLKSEVKNESPSLAKHLQIIEDEVATSDKIIRDLLEMSQGKEPSKDRVDLTDLIGSVLDRVPVPPAVQTSVDMARKPFFVLADPVQLGQVFQNLLLNSIQAMEGRGELAIAAQHGGGYDEITIRDSGPGIAPTEQNHVFEPLYTTKIKGTGLGLPICKQIVERHGGTLELETLDTPGASFRIRLPRREE